jgi:alkanesulfonate monooxygenase SsuD/methylene tetrahydromethanopterin reductase-like flavin-dependent oxidoreductase (luciferase family)
VRLGTLVSPATFRHPSVLAKNVVTVDHVSGGRVELGLGAGWHEAEHRAYGFEMPPTATRMAVLAEQLEIVHRSWTEEAFSFAGTHYRLDDLRALPKPLQRPHPPLLVGGGAGPRSVALAARFGDEYNTGLVSVEECRRRRGLVEAAWREAGRDPATVRFSLMTTCVVGRDRGELLERVAAMQAVTGGGGDPEALLAAPPPHWLIGTADELVERLRVLEQAGVTRVMLQHLAHDDVDMVAVLGEVAATLA